MIHVKFPITATRLFVVVPVALGIIAAQRAIGQKVENPKTALVNVFFHCCLEVKFPNVERSPGKLKAFDPNSGRNFAWDTGKQAWIDTKTLEPICPGKAGPPATALVNVFFHCCLEVKFPNVERSPGKLKAFDPKQRAELRLGYR
jgi:hypothetical protein